MSAVTIDNEENNEDPLETLMKTQSCFGAQQKAARIIQHTKGKDLKERLALRRLDTVEQLEDALTREIYILEYTGMDMWPIKKLRGLAKRAGVLALNPDLEDLPDAPSTLAWLIAMTIVREKIKYHFTNKRQIVIER